MTTTVLDLLRHGEPEGGRRYRGHGVDDPLSETGWAQMWAAVEAMGTGWDRVASSPLARCRAFAEQFAQGHALPLSIEPEIREVGFGVWEGLSPGEVQARHAGMLAAYRADPAGARPEGAEPAQAFFNRSTRALAAIAEQYPGDRILVIAHAGTLRAAAGWAVRAPLPEVFRIKIDYAGHLRLRFEAGRPWLDLGPY